MSCGGPPVPVSETGCKAFDPSAPTTCDGTHGRAGCCSADGKTAYFWGDNGVFTVECEGTDVCTWRADGSFYSCDAAPVATEPSGTFPLTCTGTLTPAQTGCDVTCATSADCAVTPAKPVCSTDTKICIDCLSSFDCQDPTRPYCSGSTCVANSLCTGDDTFEDKDDGPVGATDITPTSGDTSTTTGHSICGRPLLEADYFRFTVNDGDSVTLSLAWTDADKNLNIGVYDASNNSLGADYHLNPAVVKLGYLPAGTYYVSITRLDGESALAAVTPYTLSFARTAGKCTSLADCAKDGSSSVLRGSCTAAGACVDIAGQGSVAKDGACDSDDDCSSGVCAASLFNTDAARFAFCSSACTADAQCGANQVCTAVFETNHCTARCTKDSECPIYGLDSIPLVPGATWDYLTCNVATGKCTL
ncbi:MAG: hypothetical protein EOO75_02890 [Myxococcales bacterium]|nr:MAG: hypothetical protein EOO75_02890 [Myxococcales bacterium]